MGWVRERARAGRADGAVGSEVGGERAGSRVHVYHFKEKDGQLELQSDRFEQLKPGLSHYADNPKKAAESLKPLIEIALETVPRELQARLPSLSCSLTAFLNETL